jgi:chemotaxis protein MotA
MDIYFLLGLIIMMSAFGYSNANMISDWRFFIQIKPLILVFSGVFSSIIMTISLTEALDVIKAIFYVPYRRKTNPKKIVKEIVEIADIFHRGGRLSLQDKLETINDDFLAKGIKMIVDKESLDYIESILINSIEGVRIRHKKMIKRMKLASLFAILFGAISSLTNIVMLLNNLSNTQQVGLSISIALLGLVYGVLIAIMFFIPLSIKLQKISDEELFVKGVILEGLLMVSKGEIPLTIERNLSVFL